MISDLNNPLIRSPQNPIGESTSVSRQNQQAVLQVGQKLQNSASGDPYKFPTNEEIDAKTELALQLQAQGQPVKRGSIVNILV